MITKIANNSTMDKYLLLIIHNNYKSLVLLEIFYIDLEPVNILSKEPTSTVQFYQDKNPPGTGSQHIPNTISNLLTRKFPHTWYRNERPYLLKNSDLV